MKTTLRASILSISIALAMSACTDAPSPAQQAGAQTVGGVVAEVIRVVGPGGLVAAGAPAGSFLGVGAQLMSGQRLSLPAGTVVLLKLGAAQLSLNEDTALTLGATPTELSLDRGEVLVSVPRGAPEVVVTAGKDVLHVGTGEARILRIGDEGDYSSLDGSTRVFSDGREVVLDAGMSMRTPMTDADIEAMGPVGRASVHVAEATDWAAILKQVQRHADVLPRGVGSLKAREAGSKFEMQALTLTDQKVEVTISGQVAHTRVEQRFENNSSKVLEGIYRFALPPDASIAELELLIGDKWMRAEMLEKKRAARIFQKIVDATIPRDPALLHWEKGSIFKMRIFPIPARGARSIRIAYTQVLQAHGGILRYRYPMDGTGSGASGSAIARFSFDARIATGGIEGLDEGQLSGLRMITIDAERKRDEHGITLHASEQDYLPTRDLGIDIPVPEAQQRVYQQAMLAQDGKAYFMLSLAPRLPARDKPLAGVDYAFVLDRSHSTTPALWALAGTVVQTMVDRLGEGDRFELLACDTACDMLWGGAGELRAADGQAAAAIKRFVEQQDLAGASDVGGMIAQAAEVLARSQRDDVERVVIYVGDGMASAGELRADHIARNVAAALGETRLEALALGARADVLALQAMAEATRGDVMRIDVTDDPYVLASQLTLRARYRAHTGLVLSLPPGAYDVHPAKLPPLRPGDRITVVGKLRGPLTGEARLHGDGIDERFDISVTPQRPDPKSPDTHLPRTWAGAQIDALTRTRGDDARREIIALSKQHSVLSRYTALLALENDAMYREFGVAREAKGTQGWDGSLADAKDSALKKNEAFDAMRKLGDDEEPLTSLDEFDADEAPEMERAIASAPKKRRAAKAMARRPPLMEGPPAARAPKPKPKGGSSLDDLLGGGRMAGQSGVAADRTRLRRGPLGLKRPPRPLRVKRPRRRHRVNIIAPAKPPSERSLARIARHLEAREKAPQERAAHRKLVRNAIVAGHASAGAYAAAWVEADPDHSRALRSLADTLASAGDPRAMRAYASAVEVRPFSPRYHKALATAYDRQRDHRRACAHRRALVSINPSNGEHHAELARCLLDAGRESDARRVLDAVTDQLKRNSDAVDRLRASLAAGQPTSTAEHRAYLHPHAAMKITLTWDDPNQKLDIGIIDSRGRRMSSLWSDNLAVREEAGKQTVTLARVKGSVRIEVTRRDVSHPDQYGAAEQPPPPISAVLRVEAHGKRTFPITLGGGSIRVATVKSGWR